MPRLPLRATCPRRSPRPMQLGHTNCLLFRAAPESRSPLDGRIRALACERRRPHAAAISKRHETSSLRTGSARSRRGLPCDAGCGRPAGPRAGMPSSLAAARRPSSIAPAGSEVIDDGLSPSHAFPLRGARRAHRGRAAARARQELPVRRRARLAAVRGLRRRGRRHAEAAAALEDEAQALAQRLGVDHLELRNVAARHPGLADAGSLRHVPQGNPAGRGGQHAGHSAQAAGHGAQGHQERTARARSTRRRTASSRSTPTMSTGTARRRCRSATSRRCSGCSATTAKC